MESPVRIGEEEEKDRCPPPKKVKLSKVAEMVLVLAAMGKMRSGGVGPTDAEVAMMSEARDALAGVCEGFAPADVFPKEVLGKGIADLGLDRLKEQNLGSRPPKISIADRVLASKRKMEKADEFSLTSKIQSSHGIRPLQMSQMANPNQIAVATGILPSGTPSSHGIPGSLTSPYQLPSSEIRPVISSASSSSHFGPSGLPRADSPHLKSNARLDTPLRAFPAQENYSVNSSVTPLSMQPQTDHPAMIGTENKAPVNMAVTAEQVANFRSGFSPQMTSRTDNTQRSTAVPSQSTKQVHASLAYSHSEIGKIIQKLLQPQAPEMRKWVPPSREYMNRALTCQVCMSTVTEVDSILICDACEKGYHLKCLQTTTQKVPGGEWHCKKCLSVSSGKPLPPKYGRVMRNMGTPKTSSSNSEAVTVTSSKNVSTSSDVAQSKIAVNGSLPEQNIPTVDATHGHQVPGAKVDYAKSSQVNNLVTSRVDADTDDKLSSGSSPNTLIETSRSAYVSSASSPADEVCEQKNVLNANTPEKPEVDSNLPDHLLATHNAQDKKMVDLKSENLTKVDMDSSNKSFTISKDPSENFSLPKDEKPLYKDSKELFGGEIIDPNSSLPKERVVNPSETALASGSVIDAHSSSDGLHVVDWVGDLVQDSHEKLEYASCNINGHEYRIMDHVLTRFQNDKLVPAKLQTMWEDKITKEKWVSVTRCYFAEDFPETVGRPHGLESNEVCESSRESTMMAGLIEGPCEVLPSGKYVEEVERRRHHEAQQNDHLPPLYLCRWIYDEAKGLFRDISC